MASHNFIDQIKLEIRSGKGGSGSCYLHRDRLTIKGGPEGGDGGRGGHVILRGNSQMWTLIPYRYKRHIKADDGGNGGKNRLHGANGKDIYLDVPLGTIVKSEEGAFLMEVTEDNQTQVLLQGGIGGRGNWHFKSPTRQTPRYAQPGKEGLSGLFTFELKVLADVGLIGFPNAGKSTLLASISAAKPRIASYPFTTLVPNLGIVPYKEYRSFSVADIPGIIEGAHTGKGLGTRFLRHIERNSSLLFLVSCEESDPRKTYDQLLTELSSYNKDLLIKKRILIITKADIIGHDTKKIEDVLNLFPSDLTKMAISSASRFNLEPLKDLLWNTLNAQ